MPSEPSSRTFQNQIQIEDGGVGEWFPGNPHGAVFTKNKGSEIGFNGVSQRMIWDKLGGDVHGVLEMLVLFGVASRIQVTSSRQRMVCTCHVESRSTEIADVCVCVCTYACAHMALIN